ncbi:MAG: DNA mismatch endonuclease Vsr [Bryobacterales bacterium]
MADVFSKEERSRVMRRVKGADTKPEMRVRRRLHALGFRYSLHRKDLPGKPDIVLRKYKTVVFVHGCFWHGHSGCKAADLPASNRAYWDRKIGRNLERDKRNQALLREKGWRIIVIWECRLADLDATLAPLLAAREELP